MARDVVFGMEQLQAAGFEVVPAFRTPHVTIAFADDFDSELTRLAALGTDRRPNAYHDEEPH